MSIKHKVFQAKNCSLSRIFWNKLQQTGMAAWAEESFHIPNLPTGHPVNYASKQPLLRKKTVTSLMKSILGNKIILHAKLPFVIVFQWLLIMQMYN